MIRIVLLALQRKITAPCTIPTVDELRATLAVRTITFDALLTSWDAS